MQRAALLVLGLLSTSVAQAGCDREVPVSELYDALELAQMAFSGGDSESTVGGVMYAEAVFPCVVEPIQRPSVAQYHRLIGLKSSVLGDTEKAQQAWGAARALEPLYTWPPEYEADTNALFAAYDDLDVSSLETSNHPPAASGYLMFDGRPGQQRVTTVPTVVQKVGDSGKVEQTVYLWPSDEMLVYEAFRAPTGPDVATGTLGTLPPPQSREVNRPLLASAGGAAVVGAALWGVAALQHRKWADPSTDYADLAGLEKRTNGLMVGASVAGVAAAGLGVTVVATW